MSFFYDMVQLQHQLAFAGDCCSPAVIKLLMWLQEPSSVEKVAEVDQHIGVAMSGLTADARTLIDHARVEAQVIFTLCE